MARTILAVDDNPADLSRIEKLLSNAGYQVTTAVNGQAALDAVKQAKPDCVVMLPTQVWTGFPPSGSRVQTQLRPESR